MSGWSGRGAGMWGWLLLALCVLPALTACDRIPFQGAALMGEGRPPGYVGGDIPEEYSGMKNPFTPDDRQAVAAGASLYIAYTYSCASCHGVDGRGNGPMASYLDFGPADFASGPMLDAFRDSQDYVFWWVSEGVTKTQMPAYKARLTETERWQVITYSWFLGRNASQK